MRQLSWNFPKSAIGYKRHAYFELGATVKIFNKLIVKTADRSVCYKERFFHNAAETFILWWKSAPKNGRFLCWYFLRFFVMFALYSYFSQNWIITRKCPCVKIVKQYHETRFRCGKDCCVQARREILLTQNSFFFTCALLAHDLACGKDWNTCGAVPKRSGGMSRG